MFDHDEADELGGEILAAAIALRDSSGRDRLSALRNMSGTRNVARQEKVGGKWKNRSLTAVAKDIEAAVCDAALRWEHHHVAEQTDQPDLAIHDSGFMAHVESIDLEVDCEADGGDRPASLFRQDNHEDCALMEWLQAREMNPRCGLLLKQIMEWSEIIATPTGRQQKTDMRALARAQGIKMPRQARGCDKTFRETVRHHFKAAVAQEKRTSRVLPTQHFHRSFRAREPTARRRRPGHRH